jgi:predicted amidohydrolase
LRDNKVSLVIIIACWGNFVRTTRPLLVFGRTMMIGPWSRIAAEVVPSRYATQLGVPTIFVNQSGHTRLTTTLPAPLDLPLPDAGYEFYGQSRILDAAGQVVVQAPETNIEYCAVANVAVDTQAKHASPVYEACDNRYLKRGTYFVQPPPVAKVFQAWSSYGYQSEYERRRTKHSPCDE